MTRDQMIDLLLARLLREHGRSKHHWRKAIGAIRLYDRETHPHCNWSVTPTGSVRDVALIESLLDDMRIAHPLLS
ncbi:MAG: hypothetical protein U9R64_09050 [Pseudomonadota bacterium]|jgi:hypothetical protein|nr:hypothetical protein [Sphingobium sp. CCH11-B1]MEA3389400.1 hypothetical protein [Pseudomonadota bacterium]